MGRDGANAVFSGHAVSFSLDAIPTLVLTLSLLLLFFLGALVATLHF